MGKNSRETFEEFIRREILRSRIWSITISLLVAIILSIVIIFIAHSNMANSVRSIQEATCDITNAYVSRLVNTYYIPIFSTKLKQAEDNGISSILSDSIIATPTDADISSTTIVSVSMIYPNMTIKLTGLVKTPSGTYFVRYVASKRSPVYNTVKSIITAFIKHFHSINGINLYGPNMEPILITASVPSNILSTLSPSPTQTQFKHTSITQAYVIAPLNIKGIDNGHLTMVFSIYSTSILVIGIAILFAIIFVASVSIITSIHASKKIAHGIALPLENLSNLVENLDISKQNESNIIDLSDFKTNTPYEIKTLAEKIEEMVKKNREFLKQIDRERANTLRAYEHVSKREKELYDAYYNFATTLARIAEKHDDITGKHIQRVGEISGFIAEKMGLPPMLVDQIRKYAPLHDIGKIMVPDKILQKKGPLTEEEWELMKKHTEFGAELIGNKQHFMVARNIALYHHEKYDGSGYPFGLKGNQIPIEAQIVAIADVYDALRDARPYKPALTHEEAMKIILEGDRRTKPEHFNPKILDIFRQYHEQIRDIYDSLK